MIAENHRAKGLGWVTFKHFPLRLRPGETLQAQGDVLQENTYELTVTVVEVTHEAVILSCEGRVGQESILIDRLTLPLLGGPVIPLDVTTLGRARAEPVLHLAWEPSVQVAPEETALLIIGQWL